MNNFTLRFIAIRFMAIIVVLVLMAIGLTNRAGAQGPNQTYCLKAESGKAKLYSSTTKWEIGINLGILDTTLVNETSFTAYLNDHLHNPLELQGVRHWRLPPLKVKFLLDLDQAAMYQSNLSESGVATQQEKMFWNKLAQSLASAFEFSGDLTATDEGTVFLAQPCTGQSKIGIPLCIKPDCTTYSSGVANTIISGVGCGYNNQANSVVLDQTIDQIMGTDTRPSVQGEKILVIVRWQNEPLTMTSYPFGRIEQGRMFIIVIGRASDPPSGFETVKNKIESQYGHHVIYISAPPMNLGEFPGTDPIENALTEITAAIQKQRPRLEIQADFPFLLDQAIASQSEIGIMQGKQCTSDPIPLDWSQPPNSGQELMQTPFEILLVSGVVSVLLACQFLLAAATFWKDK